MKLTVLTLLSGLLFMLYPQQTEPSKTVTWSAISGITLTNTDNKKKHLNPAALSVFLLLSPECPLCKNYVQVINKIQKENAPVKFYGIIPGATYTTAEILLFKKDYKPAFPLYVDAHKKLTKYLNATTTPECIVINALGIIKYRGLIDNWAYSLGSQRQVTTAHYLADALDNTLNNKPLAITNTKPVGCMINDL
jgi:thiol-disulfide isomerase/thioredoxin